MVSAAASGHFARPNRPGRPRRGAGAQPFAARRSAHLGAQGRTKSAAPCETIGSHEMSALEVIRTAHMQLTRMQRSDLADLEVMYADRVVMATLGGVRSKDEVAKYL